MIKSIEPEDDSPVRDCQMLYSTYHKFDKLFTKMEAFEKKYFKEKNLMKLDRTKFEKDFEAIY